MSDVPPIPQRARYGNPAFRVWHARLTAAAEDLLRRVLPASLADAGAAAELAPYLCEAFGSAARIDYGTGHETAFFVLLFCLARLGLVRGSDLAPLAAVVFAEYMITVRTLQRAYWQEPAGSHGVWSLDDYQFLVFLLGAAQLAGNEALPPRAAAVADTRAAAAGAWLYFDAVTFVCDVKAAAPFAEHSPILHDLSGLASWTKVADGLAKMYRGEVLSKLPVVQHFAFGSLFAATWTPSRPPTLPEATAHAAAVAARDSTSRARAAADEAAAHAATVPVDRPEGTAAPWLTSPAFAESNAAARLTLSAAHAHAPSLEPASSTPHVGDGVVALMEAVGPLPPLHGTPAEADAADALAAADFPQAAGSDGSA